MIVLFWDIDGTLLSTGRAGVRALELAAEEMAGRPVDLSKMSTAGLTDGQIAALILSSVDVEEGDGQVDRFLRIYERELPGALPLRVGKVMPNVREILSDLDGDPEVVSLLLTGNTEAGAGAKLAHYDLSQYFHRGGAFCVDGRARSTIAERALLALDEPVAPEDAIVVGDTVHDIECARAVGMRCIAVATGGGTVDELQAAGAWRVVQELPDPAEFRRLIGLTRP